MDSVHVRYISEWFVKPQYVSEQSEPRLYLTPWDLGFLSLGYMQAGLLFATQPHHHGQGQGQQQVVTMKNLLEGMKSALSLTLVHYYPLAGRLETSKQENPPSYYVFVDCNNSPGHGAKLIHAALDMTVSDIVSPNHVPSLVVRSLFDHDGAVNHDGHAMPLLSVQVTELVDGIFVGFSMNHSIGDGISLWHFTNALAQAFETRTQLSSRLPVLKRWFPDGHGPLINLPFTHHHEFVHRFEVPQILERVFHFSSESLAKLKARANSECVNASKISSLQSLSAMVWRSITKARHFPHGQVVTCSLTTDNRSRMDPPLSPYYFGNAVQLVGAVATAGELLEQSLGWAAWKLHEAVANHDDKSVRALLNQWLCSPFMPQHCGNSVPNSIFIGYSPRFNMYENEFGLGKALAILTGYNHKFDGMIDTFPGREGGGSIDLMVCLKPCSMYALESDEEFMSFVSSPSKVK